jgi:predicted O-methyltransferase YrrM
MDWDLADKYATDYSSTFSQEIEDVLLQTTTHPQAHLASSRLQGQLLSMISFMCQPLRALEIGTFTGFSTICLAMEMPQGSELHTIELRAEDAVIANSYFNKIKTPAEIILHVGDAKQVIPTLSGQWDLIFIDADKTGYIDYYELTLPSLNKGGVIIVDNVLFHGKVFETPILGKNAKAIQLFNEHLKNDNRVAQVILPIRDGISIIRKL